MTLRIPDHIVWQDVPGELAVFDSRTESYHALNGSAAAIWRHVANQPDRAALTTTLAADYGVPPEAIAGDVAAFVDDALAKGLLEDAAA